MSIYEPRVVAATPPPELKFRWRFHPREALGELWRARSLIRTLAERDIRVRYKQAFLGMAWALLSPLGLMVAFTLIFEHAGHIGTHGVPYPLFSYVGLLPWTFFASSFTSGGSSIISEKSLLNKVFFPRETFPLSQIAVAVVDTALATSALLVLFAIEGYAPRGTSVWVPLLLLILVATAIGASLMIAACLVYFRDLRLALPLIMQLGLFISPVGYSFDVIPKAIRIPYSILDPIAPVIDGLRRSVLMGQAPRVGPLIAAACAATVILIGGYALFKRMEIGFADIA